MDRPRIYVYFNEFIEPDLVLISSTDTKLDSSGAESMKVYMYTDEVNEHGASVPLLDDGIVERHPIPWANAIMWCCRIDDEGIRHASDEGA